MPWWECIEPIMSDEDENGSISIGTELTEGRKFKIGSLVQVGWLLENEHRVWFGVMIPAQESFRVISRKRKNTVKGNRTSAASKGTR